MLRDKRQIVKIRQQPTVIVETNIIQLLAYFYYFMYSYLMFQNLTKQLDCTYVSIKIIIKYGMT